MFSSDGFDIRQGIAKLGVFQADKQDVHAVGFGWRFHMKGIEFVIDIQAVFLQTFFSLAVCDDPEIFFVFAGKSHNQIGTDSACSKNSNGANRLIHNNVSSQVKSMLQNCLPWWQNAFELFTMILPEIWSVNFLIEMTERIMYNVTSAREICCR